MTPNQSKSRTSIVSTAKLSSIRTCDVTGRPLFVKDPSEEQLRNSVFRILRENVLCSIATVTQNSQAHINTAYFCYSDELEVYFLSHPGSLHCRNLATNPSAAIAIFSSSQIWTNPGRGLQLFGLCSETRGEDWVKGEELYSKRFPAFVDWKAALSKTDLAQEYRLFRFVARSLKLHDEATFGEGVFALADVK